MVQTHKQQQNADCFWDTPETARFLGMSPGWLAKDRKKQHRGKIPFHQFGRAVRYLRSEVISWAGTHRGEVEDGGE